VLNRLFDDLRDAEGYDIFGRPDAARRPLAALRAPSEVRPVEARPRERAGQVWAVCEAIGREAAARLRVSRTSSQDPGVAATTDVVVATAALEVGFNDPTVGAVVQHKSPREPAAFVQRKGRAGRTARMRPWTVTVLSDYGRDRLTYQTYEQLFDPVLPPQGLPVRNQYVLRMQAAFALIDFIANSNPEAAQRGWWWRPLNGPTVNPDERRQQRGIRELVKRLMEGDGDLREQLARHLQAALQVSATEAASLMWEAPRSLMLEVLPTIDRRLADEWRVSPALQGGSEYDLRASPPAVHPLPDFLPPNLFSDLNLPEVSVIVPPATVRHEERRETLPIVQALRELAPGRVSRRFAVEHGGLQYWVPIPLDGTEARLPVGRFAEQYEYVTQVRARLDGEVRELSCFRPWTMRLQRAGQELSAASNAFLDWVGELVPAGEGALVQVRRAGDWEAVLAELAFHLHGLRAPVTVRRFATAVDASIRFSTGEELLVHTEFTTEDGAPAAVGFAQEVDGLCVRLTLPDGATLGGRAARSTWLPAWRTAFFRDRVLGDRALSAETNQFQRDWLQQVYLSALVAEASRLGTDLAEACGAMHGGDLAVLFGRVLRDLFQGNLDATTDAEQDEDAPLGRRTPGKLQQRLSELLARPSVLARLRELASTLWQPAEEKWAEWLRERTHETLGEALLAACGYLSPRQATLDALLLDLQRGPDAESQGELWITESALGGAGVMAAIAEQVADQPARLYRALEAALAPGDMELTATRLERFLALATDDPDVRDAVARLRARQDHGGREEARAALFALLARRGLVVDHATSAALHHRLMRPGTDIESDRLLADALRFWSETEVRLGIAIDLRVFCFMLASDPVFQPRLRALVQANTGAEPCTAEIVGVLTGMLWPRPAELRSRSLSAYSPFHRPGYTDPALVRELLLPPEAPPIALGEDGWRERLIEALAARGTARLAAPEGRIDELQLELLRLVATPVDTGYLQFYPAIDALATGEGGTVATLVLRELL
jgi:hypothetical protein